jgi:hypothetical protein
MRIYLIIDNINDNKYPEYRTWKKRLTLGGTFKAPSIDNDTRILPMHVPVYPSDFLPVCTSHKNAG